jgi:hypothetical protein
MAPFVPAGLEAAPVAEEELAPAHGDVVAAAVPVEEDAAADASEAAHAAELEAALLAASSPGARDPWSQRSTQPSRRSRPPKRAPC